MTRVLMIAGLLCGLSVVATAHGVGTTPITWNREIARLVYDKCASCHRPEGTAFSLMTYVDAQPKANEIKAAVLSRQMPPWGAIKGFGNFRNDQALTQEQIELFTKWVDGGISRGNNRNVLPKEPTFEKTPPQEIPANLLRATGQLTLNRPFVLDGLLPEKLPPGSSLKIVAALPGGAIEPLVWLHGYDSRFPHPFLFRRAIALPAGTVIRGIPADAVIALMPPPR